MLQWYHGHIMVMKEHILPWLPTPAERRLTTVTMTGDHGWTNSTVVSGVEGWAWPAQTKTVGNTASMLIGEIFWTKKIFCISTWDTGEAWLCCSKLLELLLLWALLWRLPNTGRKVKFKVYYGKREVCCRELGLILLREKFLIGSNYYFSLNK